MPFPVVVASLQLQLTAQLEDWADEYDGDYELHILGRRTIVVTDASELRHILALRPTKFKRGLTPASIVGSKWVSKYV